MTPNLDSESRFGLNLPCYCCYGKYYVVSREAWKQVRKWRCHCMLSASTSTTQAGHCGHRLDTVDLRAGRGVSSDEAVPATGRRHFGQAVTIFNARRYAHHSYDVFICPLPPNIQHITVMILWRIRENKKLIRR